MSGEDRGTQAGPDPQEAAQRRRRQRSVAIALALVALAVLFYAVTLVKGPGLLTRPM